MFNLLKMAKVIDLLDDMNETEIYFYFELIVNLS